MSTLTMRAHSVLPSAREILRDDRRPLDLPSRPRSEVDRIELPSIRQAVPELQLRICRDAPEPRLFSPTSGSASVITPTEYVHSPSMNKRRRLSSEEDLESEPRDYAASRVYRSPTGHTQHPRSGGTSPSSSHRVSGSWSGSNRTSPYTPTHGLPSMRSPPAFETASVSRAEWRPTLPSLPSLTLERASPQAQTPQGRSNWSEYALDTSRAGGQAYSQMGPSLSPQSNFHPQSFSYSSHQQPRNQSYSGPSSHSIPLSHDRTPFSSLGYHPQTLQTQDAYMSSYGEMGFTGDSKTRKRRGNLPKETTDKLRAWFVAHLQHPYPTEDEKQELMRLTGLQMNQISNWFINARRRQLPTMINNARAESDARSARSADNVAQGAGRGSVSLGESEGEYEDEFESPSTLEIRGGMGKGEAKSV